MEASPSLAVSFLAGIVAFLSPCIVPLVPSYVSFIGGVAATEAGTPTASRRGVVFARTLLFVLGFTLVFVALGVLFSGSGALFSGASTVVNLVAGALVVVLGLNIIFDFWKFLNFEHRFHFSERPAGHAGAVLIGMAFGAGWTPCIGPILAGILLLAGTSGDIAVGMLYLTAFSLGLGLPFVLAGIFFDRVASSLRKVGRLLPAIKIASGVLLVGVGVLIALGQLQRLSSRVALWGARLAVWDAANAAASRNAFAVAVLVVTAIPLLVSIGRRSARASARTRPGLIVRVSIASTGLCLAVLNVTGAINIASLIARWFAFSGL